jgi:ubiquinone/menaquinone biosynthesis C-methylase UbiE
MYDGSSSKKIRESILSKYYDEVYQSYLFQNDLQGFGIRYFEKQIEKYWSNKRPKNVLEIGGGNGEHLQYLNYIPTESYKSLDLRIPKISTYVNQMEIEFKSKFEFVTGDAQILPFDNEKFDRVFSTCLLHHVDDVLSVLLEVRRVTEAGGEIAFVFPTDPGILNQLIKKLISYRKIRKMTDIRPALFYALDHKNHVLSITELIKFVFALDDLVFHYRPFRFKSWNMNLLIVAQIIKKS